MLIVDRALGIDARVGESVIARENDVLHRAEEFAVLLGHQFVQFLLQFLERQFVVALFLDTVAEHGFAAAMLEEMPQHLFVVEALEEHFLVVAGQIANLAPLPPLACGFNDPRALGAPIDEVSEEDDRGLGLAYLRVVLFDREYQFVEQVTPAVNVADDVEALAFRNLRTELG